MPVMKFGGSSVADAQKISNATGIIAAAAEKIKKSENAKPPVVVVSAMKGVTDMLINAASSAENGGSSYKEILDGLKEKHHNAIEKLLTKKKEKNILIEEINALLSELSEILHGVELVRECSPRTNDFISGFGERLSSKIIAAHLKDCGIKAVAVDAREIIRTDNNHGRAAVDFKETERLTRAKLSDRDYIAVVTGFIASTADGVATTLGRNGSDYTASILGAALNEKTVEIWTDVDGILTADPRIVPDAKVIDEISFQEAMELSYFGAEVIHPYTLLPAMEKNIPVFIKNTMNPSAPGTRIAKDVKPKNRPITGIASIDNVSMVTIEGGGMVGMPGIAGRIFSSVANAGANIIMISQASSEHSICLVCREEDSRKAASALKKDLNDALSGGIIRNINLDHNLEIVAVIGENMKGHVGLSGKLFSALGNAGVNILAIAQGSTELNISFVIEGSKKKNAISAIHKSFIG